MNDNGNKYFRKRRLYKNTFVEDYLSRNNRTLSNFMTRMFILAPNLINKMHENPRYDMLKKEWCEKKSDFIWICAAKKKLERMESRRIVFNIL